MAFVKATKAQAKLRLACYGPSGSGKTVSGIRVLSGMCKRIACIDTERGRARKCAADWCDFDVMEIPPTTTVKQLIAHIGEAAAEGYDGLVIDSLSHSWNALLEEVNNFAAARCRGNTHAAWGIGKFNDLQASLVDAIMSYPGHVWATMRSRTAWAEEKDERTGKTKPVKVGLDPVQGKQIEYDFDFLMSLTPEHYATIEKGPKNFADRVLKMPDESFGKELLDWCDSGEVVVPQTDWQAECKALVKGLDDAEKKAKVTAVWQQDITWAEKHQLIKEIIK